MKRFLPVFFLALSALVLWCGLRLGLDGLSTVKSDNMVLLLPPVRENRKAPAVLLSGGSRGIAVELSRRGYVTLQCSPGMENSAYELLSSREEIDPHNIALIACGYRSADSVIALNRELVISDLFPRAMIMWNCSSDDSDEFPNVLTLCGTEESELEGFFAEGNARLTLPYGSRKNACIKSIEWLGSTLGHPRDGVLSDSQLVFPYAGICYGLSALLALAGFIFLFRKKTHHDSLAESIRINQ